MLPRNNTGAQMAVAPHQDIVRLSHGELFTTSEAIAAGTKVQHKNVLELIRTHMESLRKFGPVAFETRHNGNGTTTESARLNESQATLLIAFMRNSALVVAFKVELVRCFYGMRAALSRAGAATAPTTLREALILALAQTERIDELETKAAADAPKVAFAEAIRAVDGVCSIEKIAKTLGIGRNKFFKRLRDDSILLANNLPYQKYIDREYFTVVEGTPYVDSKDISHPTFTTMVTGAGQVFLARKYGAQPANIAEKEAA